MDTDIYNFEYERRRLQIEFLFQKLIIVMGKNIVDTIYIFCICTYEIFVTIVICVHSLVLEYHRKGCRIEFDKKVSEHAISSKRRSNTSYIISHVSHWLPMRVYHHGIGVKKKKKKEARLRKMYLVR